MKMWKYEVMKVRQYEGKTIWRYVSVRETTDILRHMKSKEDEMHEHPRALTHTFALLPSNIYLHVKTKAMQYMTRIAPSYIWFKHMYQANMWL